MTLLVPGEFTSHSGQTLHWKIECDALTLDDWAGAARMAVDYLPPFGDVFGIPRGGLAFADALRPYCTQGPLLIVDDVCTTGASLEAARVWWAHQPIGCVLFARGPCPPWVTPLFSTPAGGDQPDRNQP